MNESLYNILIGEGVTPERIEEIMAMIGLGTEGEYASQALTRAENLQATPAPRGRYAGRVYVSANPLEHLAAGLNRFRGLQEQREAQSRQEAILEALRRGTGAFVGVPRQMPTATGTPRRPNPDAAEIFAAGTNPSPYRGVWR